jgi:hypothetical protein
MITEDNDGRTPVGSNISKIMAADAVVAHTWHEDDPVEVRYPLPDNDKHDRSSWPWLPGTILAECGPDEWQVCVEVRELATLEDGRPPHRKTLAHNLFYPLCFRDSSEIRVRARYRTSEPNFPE